MGAGDSLSIQEINAVISFPNSNNLMTFFHVIEIANEFIWSLNIGSEDLEDFNKFMT